MLKDFESSLETLKTSNRAIIKQKIVAIYRRAVREGKTTYLELENAERLFESYKELQGNSYIDDLMIRLRRFKGEGEKPEDLLTKE